MTIKELSKYYNTKKEIQQLMENITEIESTIIGSSKITGMPITQSGNSSPTERIGTKLVNLKNDLLKKSETLLDQAKIIEDYLTTVENGEIRIIIRKRFLEGKTWNTIGDELSMDRSTPYYIVKNYLKGSNE